MEALISQLVGRFEQGRMTRRELIQGLAMLATAGGAPATAFAQTGAAFHVANLDHLSYQVADYGRTRDFYANLLGMPVANDNGKDTAEVHFGEARGTGNRDRTMMSLHANATMSRIDHIAWKIDNCDTDRVRMELERRGLKPRLARGGALDTPNYVSFNVQDPDGLGVQISGIARPGDSQYRQP